LSQSNLIGDRSVPYMMPPERSIMIDYMYQFEMIKLIIEGRDK
jgi:CMP-N-acetylneuraminic acid synthetase